MSTSPFAFDWVFEHAALRPDAPAVGTPGGFWLSYSALAMGIRAFAARLAGLGVRPGDFVVISLPNGPTVVAAALGAQLRGACAVELSRDLGARATEAVLAQTEPTVAIVQGRDAGAWGAHARARGLRHLLIVHSTPPSGRMAAALDGVSWSWAPELDASTAPEVSVPEDRRGDAPALLVYTSGSTGEPRGVVQTHENIAANTEAICRYLALTRDDRVMSILPLFYCYGKSLLQTHLHAGGSVLFDNRFMYPRVVLETMTEERCTGFAGVPLTFELIRRQVDLSTLSFPALRYVTQAGGPMHPETIRWARAAFAPAQLFVMYGQTEATARLSYLPPERAEEKQGSIGRGLDNVELRVVDDTGAEVPVGEVGQLVARGPSVTSGYFRAPEETASILRDGWLWTGDLARRDDEGFLFIVGRSKDMLKLGGHRVSALELEQVLGQHPAVVEVAVVGREDPTGGEAAVAFVVPTAGGGVDPNELRRFCRERLPAFKVPRDVEFVERLPRTAAGKVAKAELRERSD